MIKKTYRKFHHSKGFQFHTQIHLFTLDLRRIGNGKYDIIWSDGKILHQMDYADWSKKTKSFEQEMKCDQTKNIIFSCKLTPK